MLSSDCNGYWIVLFLLKTSIYTNNALLITSSRQSLYLGKATSDTVIHTYVETEVYRRYIWRRPRAVKTSTIDLTSIAQLTIDPSNGDLSCKSNHRPSFGVVMQNQVVRDMDHVDELDLLVEVAWQ